MKICFILNQIYKSGGIERVINNRLNELSKEHDIYVIMTENGQRPFYFGALNNVKYFDLNLNFYRKENGGFKLTLYNMFMIIFSFFKLQCLLLKIKPDVTVNVDRTHFFYFLPFIFGKGVSVLEHHSSFYQDFPNNFKKNIMKKYMYHVFLNKEEAKLADFLKNKIIIPNPIKIDHQELIPFPLRKNKILAAGRIVEVKGFDRLILAWSLIHEKYPNWVLEIYGDGDKKVLNDLDSLIHQLNMIDRIIIKPATPHIIDLMVESKIYAMTSYFESFGMVLLEAMSAGMLVVSFDCPTGPRNIIDDQVGFLVEDGNIESFAEKISEIILMENNFLERSENAYKRSLDYSVINVGEKWNNFIFSIK